MPNGLFIFNLNNKNDGNKRKHKAFGSLEVQKH